MKTHSFFSTVFISALLVGLIAMPADGQESRFATQGDVEIAGSISFSSITPVSDGQTSNSTSIFSLGPQIGYFVTDGFEIGFNPGISLLPGISVISPSSGNSTTMLQLFFYPGYNLRPEGSNIFPFLEVPLGYTSISDGSTSESGFSWGVKGGAKIAAAKHLLLTVFVEYLQVTLNPSETPTYYGVPSSSGRNGFNFISFGVGVGGFF